MGSASYGLSQLAWSPILSAIRECVGMTHFWGYVRPAATQPAQQPCLSGLLALKDYREAKVCYLESTSRIKQEIFWLQVTMADTFTMDIILR
jgi:hypothetical protein